MAQLWYKKGEAFLEASAKKRKFYEDMGFEVCESPNSVKPKEKAAPVKEEVRARNEKGHYKADDPKTPENEAYVSKKKAKKK